MAKKKKGKKGKKKSAAEEAPPTKLYDEFNKDEKDLIKMLESKKDWVHVELKLKGWTFGSFTTCVRTSTPLTYLIHKIEEQHARITDLRLFRNPLSDKNEIKEEEWGATLKELGIHGGSKDDQEKAVFYFDFQPARSDAILLKEPNLMIPEDNQRKPEPRGSTMEARGSMDERASVIEPDDAS